MSNRKIKTIINSTQTSDGAGVHLKRMFAYHEAKLMDPFLMLDDFSNDNLQNYIKGFPWHPHRGIETITYMLKGSAEHGDSLGNTGIISGGDVQWMTSGSGIIHQEMPIPDHEGKMYGFQLWVNLPAGQKMCKPRYQNISQKQIPIVNHHNGTTVKVICGTYNNVSGPVTEIAINPQFLDVNLPSKTEFELETIPGFTCFIYAYDGEGLIDNKSITKNQVVLFEDGDKIHIKAHDNDFRFIYLTGKPLHEAIAWRGPIVMNTDAEINLAFDELNSDTFIKK